MLHKTPRILLVSGLYQTCRLSRTFSHENLKRKKHSKNNFKWEEPQGHDTSISIYNTYLKQKVKLISRQKNLISWYCCGPTVYDSAHIGHASCYVAMDIIRRILTDFCGINVVFVMGLTNIDDKILNRSKEVKQDFRSLAEYYEREFKEDMHSLNVIPPSALARVTDYIPHIISFIQQIVEKGHGYVAPDGSVYFSVESLNGLYGKLEPEQESGDEGVVGSQGKRHEADFALWKSWDSGWSSPWGPGRPGWHIECSAIASHLLGKTLDIHSGGIDLRFPHHENEEAQCCAYHDINQWVNYWIHTGHLYLKGDVKMSKSLKNTLTIKDFLKKYTSDELRMFCLLSPYRNGKEFSDLSMDKAVALCKKFNNFFDDCETVLNGYLSPHIDEVALIEKLIQTEKDVLEALKDDFDTPKAIMHLTQLVGIVNSMIHSGTQSMSSNNSPTFSIAAVLCYMKNVLNKLGFIYQEKAENKMAFEVNSIVDTAVCFRSEVRQLALSNQNKEWSAMKDALLHACDTFREKFFNSGVQIKDGKKTAWSFTKNKKTD